MFLSLAPTFNIEVPGGGRSSAWHYCPSVQVCCFSTRSWGFRGYCQCWVRYCAWCITGLEVSNCAGSLMDWEAMSLSSLLDCFRISILLLFIAILQCQKTLSIFNYKFFSLSDRTHIHGPSLQVGLADSYSESTFPFLILSLGQFIMPSSLSPWNKWPPLSLSSAQASWPDRSPLPSQCLFIPRLIIA